MLTNLAVILTVFVINSASGGFVSAENELGGSRTLCDEGWTEGYYQDKCVKAFTDQVMPYCQAIGFCKAHDAELFTYRIATVEYAMPEHKYMARTVLNETHGNLFIGYTDPSRHHFVDKNGKQFPFPTGEYPWQDGFPKGPGNSCLVLGFYGLDVITNVDCATSLYPFCQKETNRN